TVIALWADATNEEATKRTAYPDAKKGSVHCLDGTCNYMQGQTKNQTALYPPMFHHKKGKPAPPPIASLQIKGPESVHLTNRAIIIDFGAA
ncbi:hypothetical protein JAAARDRAFT_107235, partial [Jaapia argillacea MUCL 33604]